MIAEPSQSLSDLLRHARAGDAAELDRLFGACRNYLCVLAQSLVEGRLKTKADASDLVQQTLLEAYRDFAQFRGGTEQEWLAWLRRILAHNAAQFVRHYRGTGKRQVGLEVAMQTGSDGGTLPGLQPADPGESPSQQLLRKERELLIADVPSMQLPPDLSRRDLQAPTCSGCCFDQAAGRIGNDPRSGRADALDAGAAKAARHPRGARGRLQRCTGSGTAVMNDQDFTLLQGYLDELHRGGAPARDAILARRPDLAGLLECLDGLDRLAAPPADEDGAPTLPVLPAACIPVDDHLGQADGSIRQVRDRRRAGTRRHGRGLPRPPDRP